MVVDAQGQTGQVLLMLRRQQMGEATSTLTSVSFSAGASTVRPSRQRIKKGDACVLRST
jgi:hypothetical protein